MINTLTITGSTPSSPTPNLVKGNTYLDGFTTSLITSYTIINAGASSSITSHDVIATLNASSTVQTSQQVTAIKNNASNTNKFTFVSGSPSSVAVDTNGNCTQVIPSSTPSTATISATLGNYGTNNVAVSVAISVSNTYTQTGFVTNSLANHIDAAIKSMISGKSPSDATCAMYSSNTGTAATRNANNIAYGKLDLSAIAISNSARGNTQGPALLISPYHIIGANHFPAGGTVVFLGKNGTTYFTGTIATNGVLVPTGSNDLDILVQGINWTSAVPSSSDITFFKFLPSTWNQYLPNLDVFNTTNVLNLLNQTPVTQVPCLFKSGHDMEDTQNAGTSLQVLGVNVMDNPIYTNSLLPPPSFFVAGYPYVDSAYNGWRAAGGIIGGDSGGPFIFPISEGGVGTTSYVPVLLGTAHRSAGQTVSCEGFCNSLTQIQAAMNTVSSGLTVTTQQTLVQVNLTGGTTPFAYLGNGLT